ncbi:hypothetical protein TPHA_0A01460 [Tetrapisispora phaffii CBS 4417]|uniref:SH3 domain-containing protein n=1 Tax=Tetrapisispora phaffii (strain ATCC 24235 / CBS 4417 / NBRC 1672 / NRRL Y-8282 / UCD 70-5) TaxID=1071381 RepID=G8BMV1_TETPH|nr:hypothetical protein TPHA_0A01460 [Tetrapisispora phaffii CBS 4417]CCE61229.1 hypothetical protein TPHA_0A01460 [Tetrapisispora phaffii CBS 4417]
MSKIGVIENNHMKQETSQDEHIEEISYLAGADTGVGFISIKDFAYDKSNPLHYGYFEDNSYDENEEGYMHSEADGIKGDEDLDDRRQSFILPETHIINCKAIALYAFEPENENELELQEGDIIFISYKHGQGWLVAENYDRTHTGLVPEEYISYLDDDDDDGEEMEDKARPFYLTQFITQSMDIQKQDDNEGGENEGEWEDIDELNNEVQRTLKISE